MVVLLVLGDWRDWSTMVVVLVLIQDLASRRLEGTRVLLLLIPDSAFRRLKEAMFGIVRRCGLCQCLISMCWCYLKKAP